MPSATATNRQRMWSELVGNGPPVLLLPGVASVAQHWGSEFVERLSSRHRVVLLEYRGTGRSPRTRDPCVTRDLADDAAALARSLGLRRYDVIGFSFGGMVAQELVLRDDSPEPKIDHVVLLSTRISGEQRGPREALSSLVTAMKEANAKQAVEESWRANVSPAFAANAPARERWESIAGAQPFPLRILHQQLDATDSHDIRDRIKHWRVPTLVVHGSADAVIPVQQARLAAHALPRAELFEVADVGHLAHWEKPKEVADRIMRFLAA